LINDILDISRIEAGKEEIDLSSFNMSNMVKEMVTLIKPQAEIKNILLTCATEDKDLRIHSDLKKIQHILQNIIGNAVKFTEKGQVTVSCRAHLSRIEVIVTDTGIGISESNINHIFDEFRQADGSTSRRYGGTGLGLAIARKYAQLLKGTISVVSELNVGSCFTLSLPLLFDDSETTSVEEIHFDHKALDIKTIKNLNSKTVLLVDDNETALIQIRDLLSETGIRVLTASNAQDAFLIIEKDMPDAMVLDLMMPDIDGFKMLEILRNAPHTAHIPVLILSAKHLTKEDLKFLRRNNVHELILKGSVQRESLQNAIGSMLNSPLSKKKPNMIRQDKVKPLVLVVEDNPDNMTTVKALLGEDFKIIEAINGQEAINKAKAAQPDLILMDIALPDINGIDAYKKIRTLKALDNTPIIALTASAMEHDRESILLHGFDAFIAKPINAKDFLAVIDEVLYGR
jgi:CheY-like chemotaxis protein/anti-sigma regulatory factor (Ser/Thr protein kinase)